MSAMQIFEDQENHSHRLPGGKGNENAMAVQQKRIALGALNNTQKRMGMDGQLKKQQKQGFPLAPKIFNHKPAFSSDLIRLGNKENRQAVKNVAANKKGVVIPGSVVAQFEAFKVYEDGSRTREKCAPKAEDKVSENSLDAALTNLPDDAKMKAELLSVNDENREPAPKVAASWRQNHFPRPREDPWFVEEYQDDIYRYLRKRELNSRAKAYYMKKQPDINYQMRSILVDWLVEVAEEYSLHNETLHLAVNLVDRFLSYMSVVRGKLQLVGTAAMFTASKYEEIHPPEVGEFVYITDDTYKTQQVVRMEQLILNVVDFDLSVPTPIVFITYLTQMVGVSTKVRHLALYLTELAMLEGDPYLEFLSSELAASAIALARHTLDEEVWPQTFVKKLGIELVHMKTCIEFLSTVHAKAPTNPHQSIQDKFKSVSYNQVSTIAPNMKVIEFQ